MRRVLQDSKGYATTHHACDWQVMASLQVQTAIVVRAPGWAAVLAVLGV